ncbi:MAG: dTMP kinase [Alphaproteobacteria bacterium]
MAAGKFITFEGGEGIGEERSQPAHQPRVGGPQYNTGGNRRIGNLRVPCTKQDRCKVLLSGKVKHFGPMAEALLFYTARDSHLELTIRPALARGRFVISDRFFDSTRAYQGAAGGVSIDVLNALERIIVGTSRPDLTFILDLPPEEGLRRAKARAEDNGESIDRFEKMKLSFHEDLRREFLRIAKAEPWRCVVIDSTQPREEVADLIWNTTVERLEIELYRRA